MANRLRELASLRITIFSVLAALVTFVAVYIIDSVLTKLGFRLEATFLDNILLGILVGCLVFSLEVHHQKELRQQQEKIAILAEMNHHIRNALQTIVYVNFQNPDSTAAEKVASAATRIEWALREILPGDSPQPDASKSPHNRRSDARKN